MNADILVFSLMTSCILVGVWGRSGGMCFQELLSKMRMQFVPLVPTYLQTTLTSRPLIQNNAIIAHFSDMSEPCHRDSGHYLNINKVNKM